MVELISTITMVLVIAILVQGWHERAVARRHEYETRLRVFRGWQRLATIEQAARRAMYRAAARRRDGGRP